MSGRFILPGAAVIALLLTALLSPYRLGVLTVVATYALASLAQNLLAGYAGVPSLGNVIFFAAGAYVAGSLVSLTQIPFGLAVPCAVLFAAASGLVVGLPALRITGMHLAIVTVALVFVAQDLMAQWDTLQGTAGNGGVAVSSPGWLLDERTLYIAAILAAILGYVAIANLLAGRSGRAMMAAALSSHAATAAGINVVLYRTLAFVISGGLTGLAGVVYLYYAHTVTPAVFPLDLSLAFLTMMILGGSRSLVGSLLGALIIGLLPQALDYLPASIAGIDVQQSSSAIWAILLLLTLRFLPGGIWPSLEHAAARLRRGEGPAKHAP